jgi:hypothetical protein
VFTLCVFVGGALVLFTLFVLAVNKTRAPPTDTNNVNKTRDPPTNTNNVNKTRAPPTKTNNVNKRRTPRSCLIYVIYLCRRAQVVFTLFVSVGVALVLFYVICVCKGSSCLIYVICVCRRAHVVFTIRQELPLQTQIT